ncbi:MAG TPA: hypothetical protein VGB82_23145 [Alphaproteobacteria bacterium]
MAHDHECGLDELLRRRDAYIRHGVPAEVSAGVRAWARRARLRAMRDTAAAMGTGLVRLWRCLRSVAGGEPVRRVER